MIKNRPLLLVLASLALGVLVYLDNRGGEAPQEGTLVRGSRGADAGPVDREIASASGAVDQEDGTEASQAASPALERLANPLANFDKSKLRDWVERPLFASSRKRPPAVAAVANRPTQPTQPKAPPPSYDLLGVVRDGDRAIALLRKKGDGTSFRVEVGDMIGGWRVSKLEPAAVLLERDDGNSQMLPLRRE